MKKRVRLPVILQMEETEGGAACLCMVLAGYNKNVSLEQVHARCGISRSGIGIPDIIRGAGSFGLDCRPENADLNELKSSTMPVILSWKKGPFVVLEGFSGQTVRIIHPAKGRQKLSFEQFERSYTGSCLVCTPGKDFVPGGTRKTSWNLVAAILKKNRKILILTMLTGLCAAAGGLLSPVFSQIFTDDILTGNRISWYPAILFWFAVLIAFYLTASVLHRVVIVRATGKIAVSSNAHYMKHLLRLPLHFFARRKAGDLSNRQDLNNSIAETLIGELAPLFINLLMLVFYIVVMCRYSLLLTAVGTGTIVLNLFIISKVGTIRREISATQFRGEGNLASATVSGIDMIDTIKATGSESGYFERWSGYHAEVVKAEVKFNDTARFLLTLPSLIQEACDHTVLFMGLWLIMDGHFTAGMLLAFLQFLKSLMDPVDQLLEAGGNIQEMGASLERIDDVMEHPEETSGIESPQIMDFQAIHKLTGHVEMKNVTFGYADFDEPLIKNFDLELTPGMRIALVGGSGSGKTTIAKLLAGLYQPAEGEILFDGKRIEEIPRIQFKSSLAMVDQDIVLFHDTIENNIKMWDSSIRSYEMILSARDAGIHDFILSSKDGYLMMLQEGGKNLSGGERQRVEIARVLACDPTILIMDEATSALDARTEYEIAESIRKRGITCVIVAHRLSTIRDCDRILVMDQGNVVECGTHDELMAQGGLYRSLILTA